MTNDQTIKTTLISTVALLKTEEATLEAQLLLQDLLKVNRAWLITHENDALATHQQAAFNALLKRRLSGEPLAYILGKREFYGLDLTVTPDTLIPRPDTEAVVEAALEKISVNINYDVLDLGTGTGAIALAIATHRPQSNITAVDFSQAALKIAQQNAKNLGIANVSFAHSDWFSALQGQKFDVIVSNPPYIAADDAHLNALTFEPITALVAGADGLDDIRNIIVDALVFLKPQGWLMLEHGYNQAQHVQDLLANAGFVDIQTIQDLGGNDRVTLAKNPLIVSTHWD